MLKDQYPQEKQNIPFQRKALIFRLVPVFPVCFQSKLLHTIQELLLRYQAFPQEKNQQTDSREDPETRPIIRHLQNGTLRDKSFSCKHLLDIKFYSLYHNTYIRIYQVLIKKCFLGDNRHCSQL